MRVGWRLVVVVALTWPATARPCDPAGADADGLLRREARRVRAWNRGWAVTWGALTAGQLTLALAAPEALSDSQRTSLFVGAVGSGLAFGSVAVAPLRVALPAGPTGEGCVDGLALEAALLRTGKAERQAFFVGHAAGAAWTAGSSVLLAGPLDADDQVIPSLVTGYPLSLLQVYTQPRAAWHEARRADLLGAR